jgi:thiol-disulfide isomerase/thioredoxin
LLAAAFKQRQISQRCYEVLTAELEQRLLYWAASALLFHHREPAKANLRLQMPDGEVRKLAATLAARYNPALPRYRYSALGNLGLLAELRVAGLLPGAAPTIHTWGDYAAQFAPVNTLMTRYDYLPPATQGLAVGDVVLTALAFNAISPAEFTKVFADYRRRFPTSPYVPIIARSLPAAPKPAALVSTQNQTFGHFTAGARALAFTPAPGLDTVQTLAALVRQQFRGRPVFVDFWASWCGPCIAEFRHEDPLHEFLSKNGIEALYVSIDKPGMRDKWVALAVQNNLRGYHYLASPAVQKATERDFTQIPRYLLFDKNGTLVEPNAYHPSDGEKLYRQLRERLQLP